MCHYLLMYIYLKSYDVVVVWNLVLKSTTVTRQAKPIHKVPILTSEPTDSNFSIQYNHLYFPK